MQILKQIQHTGSNSEALEALGRPPFNHNNTCTGNPVFKAHINIQEASLYKRFLWH